MFIDRIRRCSSFNLIMTGFVMVACLSVGVVPARGDCYDDYRDDTARIAENQRRQIRHIENRTRLSRREKNKAIADVRRWREQDKKRA